MEDKDAFRKLANDLARKYNKELNYEEANKNVGLKCLRPYQLRDSVEEILSDENIHN